MFSHVQTTRTHTQVAHRDIRRFCQENGLTGPQVFEDAHGNLRLYRAPARAPLAGGGPARNPCTGDLINKCCLVEIFEEFKEKGVGLIKKNNICEVDEDQIEFIKELDKIKQKLNDGHTLSAAEQSIPEKMKFKKEFAIQKDTDDAADGTLNFVIYTGFLNVLKENINKALKAHAKAKSKAKFQKIATGAASTDENRKNADGCDCGCPAEKSNDNTRFHVKQLFEKIDELRKFYNDNIIGQNEQNGE